MYCTILKLYTCSLLSDKVSHDVNKCTSGCVLPAKISASIFGQSFQCVHLRNREKENKTFSRNLRGMENIFDRLFAVFAKGVNFVTS